MSNKPINKQRVLPDPRFEIVEGLEEHREMHPNGPSFDRDPDLTYDDDYDRASWDRDIDEALAQDTCE